MPRLLAAFLLLCPLADAQTPTEKLAALFTGQWTIVDTAVPSSGRPKPKPREGEEIWHTLAGGSPLIEEYRSQGADGTWEYDTAAIWWDASAQKYHGLFCADFLDHGCDPFEVKWPVITSRIVMMNGSYTQKGKLYHWREDFDFSPPKSFTQSLFIAQDGQELKLVASIIATRAQAATPKP